jgi:hypothetical protein
VKAGLIRFLPISRGSDKRGCGRWVRRGKKRSVLGARKLGGISYIREKYFFLLYISYSNQPPPRKDSSQKRREESRRNWRNLPSRHMAATSGAGGISLWEESREESFFGSPAPSVDGLRLRAAPDFPLLDYARLAQLLDYSLHLSRVDMAT